LASSRPDRSGSLGLVMAPPKAGREGGLTGCLRVQTAVARIALLSWPDIPSRL